MLPKHYKLKIVGKLVGHLLLSTIGVIIVSGFLIFFLYSLIHIWNPSFTPKRASSTLTELPGFPVQTALDLLAGFFLSRYMQCKVMMWTWVLPLTSLCIALFFAPKNGSSVFAHFIGSGCSPANRCFDQLLFTLPCFTAAAYAFGARIGQIGTTQTKGTVALDKTEDVVKGSDIPTGS